MCYKTSFYLGKKNVERRMIVMKPMLKYIGGKYREIPAFLQYIPQFSGRYIEPFFGGGALFFYLKPERAIINDINSKLVNFYRSVRDDYKRLRTELDDIELQYTSNRTSFDLMRGLYPGKKVVDGNELLYNLIRDMFNGKAVKTYSDALLYYFINKTAYSGMIRYNSRGEFNMSFGRYKHLNTNSVTLAHSELLQCAQVFNTDYSDIFNMCTEEDFVFLDPPYNCVFSDYGNKQHNGGFNVDSHRKLASDFANLPCKALMVVSSTPLMEKLYKGYIIDEYDKNYSVNVRNRFNAAAKHLVIYNYK